MTPIQVEDIKYIRKQADTLWDDIVKLGEKYWEVYDTLLELSHEALCNKDQQCNVEDDLPF